MMRYIVLQDIDENVIGNQQTYHGTVLMETVTYN
jgi:hypothetical protein